MVDFSLQYWHLKFAGVEYMDGFRNFVKGPLGKGLLVLFTIPFAVIGIESYFTSSSSPNVSQVVNGVPISKDEVDVQIKALREGYLQQVGGDVSLLNQEMIEKRASDNLLYRNLLMQQTNKLGIILSQAQVEQMLTTIPSFQENGVFSPAKYESYLKHSNLTSQEFVNGVRQDRAIEMLLANLMMSLINQHDVQQLNKLKNEQRQVYLASLSFAEYLNQVTASESEIQSYYDKNKNQFIQLPRVNVEYLHLPVELIKTEIVVSDVDIKNAYQNYVQNLPKTVKHILITTDARSEAEAKKRADEAYAQLQVGTSFAQVASQYSEDAESKNKGGVISSYASGQFSDSFDQAVKNTTVGQTSVPVKTNFGYHIIHVDSQQAQSIESLKEQLITQVKKQKQEIAFTELVNRLNEMAISSDSLEVIQQEVKTVNIQKVTGLTPKNKDPILSQIQVKARLFGDDVKKGDRHVSGNIQLANGDQVWVKVTHYVPSGVLQLVDIAEQVKAKVLEEKAMQMAKAKVQTMLDSFKTRPAQEVIANNTKVKFENAGYWVRGKQLTSVENLAFSLTPPKAGYWSVGTSILDKELLILAVANVKYDMKTGEEPQKLYMQEYAQERIKQEVNDYTHYLKSIAKIK